MASCAVADGSEGDTVPPDRLRPDALYTEWTSASASREKKAGDVWYCISKAWYDKFNLWIQPSAGEANGPWPGEVDNSDIVDNEDKTHFKRIGRTDGDLNALGPDILDDEYEIVTEDAWKLLMQHFGGGPSIQKHCVWSGCKVVFDEELLLTVTKPAPANQSVMLLCSKYMTFTNFRNCVLEHLELTDEEKNVMICDDTSTSLDDCAQDHKVAKLEDVGIVEDMCLSVMRKNPVPSVNGLSSGRTPMSFDLKTAGKPQSTIALPASSSVTAGSFAHRNRPWVPSSRAYSDTVVARSGRIPGLAGLQNLGNTCFMNSALQCLLHCVPVLRTFLSGDFNKDLNPDNPLGKGGEMATAFGALLQKMWRGDVDYVSPDGFKHVLGRHVEQFRSYNQHDSQEFLSYLLDMLHEDLNRVKVKPYNETPDDAGRDDEVLAREAWDTYRARNDSAIVDHFQGLLKSTLDCPSCGHHKRNFDPFMYLSVPLPGADTMLREVTVVPVDGCYKPQQYCVRLFKNDTVAAFLEAMAILLDVKIELAPKRLLAAVISPASGIVSRNARVVILDDMDKDLPHKQRWSNERLVVYMYPPDQEATEHGSSRKAVIMPPPEASGTKAPLPLLIRIPEGAIELEQDPEPKKKETGFVLPYGRPSKRFLLRPDCELARRVENLLTPFKRQRSGANLVYSPVGSCPGSRTSNDGVPPGNPTVNLPAMPRANGLATAAAMGSNVEVSDRATSSGAEDVDGDAVMRGTDADTDTTTSGVNGVAPPVRGPDADGTVAGVPVSNGYNVDGVAEQTGAVSIQSPGKHQGQPDPGTPSWMRGDSDSADQGAVPGTPVGPSALAGGAEGAAGGMAPMDTETVPRDTAQGMPVAGLMGGHEGEEASNCGAVDLTPAPARAPAPPPLPPSKPHGTSEAGLRGSIMGAVPAPAALDLTQPAERRDGGANVGPAAPGGGFAGLRGGQEEDPSGGGVGPVVRLLAVNESGGIVTTLQDEEETRFFQLDVKPADVRNLFNVEAMNHVEKHESMAQLDVKDAFTLEECIGAYLASEVLGPRDTWHCPRCRKDVRAKKALDLWCLPEVLIIHLKRFSYSGTGYFSTTSSKIDNLVTFPLQGLDMTQHVHAGNDIEAIYDCFAVSNHMGSVSGGHYTAYCMHENSLCPEGQKGCGWNCYNDRSLSPSSPGAVVTSAAYVLFYRRRSKSQQDPANIVQMCKEELQKNYPDQAAEAFGTSSSDGGRGRSESPPALDSPSQLETGLITVPGHTVEPAGNVDPTLAAALGSGLHPVSEGMETETPLTPDTTGADTGSPVIKADAFPNPAAEFGMVTSVTDVCGDTELSTRNHGRAVVGPVEAEMAPVSSFGTKEDMHKDITELSDTDQHEVITVGDGMSLSAHSHAASDDPVPDDKGPIVSEDEVEESERGRGRVSEWLAL